MTAGSFGPDGSIDGPAIDRSANDWSVKSLVWAGESRSYEYIVQDSTELQLRCLTLLASESAMTPTGGDFGDQV